MKKLLSILLVAILALTCMVGLVGCGGNSDGLAICVGPEPDTIDPALNSAVDGATLIVHAFSGLVGWRQNSTGALELFADCAKSLPTPTATADGKWQYVFELRDGLKWSDGSDLTAADFEFAWKRAVSAELAADYGYMFDVIDGYEVDAEGGFIGNLNVKAEGNKLTVILPVKVPYFYELCAFPTYMPVKQSVVGDEAWATEAATYICNGPYKITAWEHGSKIVMEKNEYYYNKDAITQDKITFYLSDDDGAQLANYKSGAWKFIDGVPNSEIATLKVDYPTEFVVAGQIGTYYCCFNINESLLPSTSTLTGAEKEAAQTEIRQALSALIDRNYVVDEIGQIGQVPASSYVAMGLQEPDGQEFYKKAGHETDYVGYYDVSKEAFAGNVNAAIESLKKYYKFDTATGKFTDFPTITYLYNEGTGHTRIAEYIQQAYGAYGIGMKLEMQEWKTFLNTRKNGEYTMARNGWLGDYNDPISFLDMWLTASGNNDVQFGKGDHAKANYYSIDATGLGYTLKVENGTWNQTYDAVIALVKSESDQQKRMDLMHLAEDLLMSTGAIVPVYFYTDLYMISDSLQGAFSSPLGYKFFMYSKLVG